MQRKSNKYFELHTEAAPLAVFRILFGALMFASLVRFWANGWIEKLYLEPLFHFSFYGFEWVKPLGVYTYLLFVVCAISALLVMVGLYYRWAIALFFFSFTYIELMDKTTYLNHYYFISVLSLVLCFLPAGQYFSVDTMRTSKTEADRERNRWIPRWNLDALKLLLGTVYFYAGLAKLNSDWMLEAMPLKIWLPSKVAIPFLGNFLTQEWVHYFSSWSGALYDLFIPFLLLWRPTRKFAFVFVILFHLMTGILFPIGMFPYIMIVSSLVFFDPSLHQKILAFMHRFTGSWSAPIIQKKKPESHQKRFKGLMAPYIVAGLLLFQLLFPWRYLLYPEELFWTEEGYRFSWRVMLMEKTGYAQFKIVDGQSGKRFYVDNSDFLTAFQEKQMSFQPDFILEYAHFLTEHFSKQGHQNVEVYVESYVSLNGRLSQPFIDPNVNLSVEKESFRHKTWILPFNDAIEGI